MPSNSEAINQLLDDLTQEEFFILFHHIRSKTISFSPALKPPRIGIEMTPTPTDSDAEAIDHLELLPDELLLHILNYVSSDIKSLCRCSSVSQRFHLLVPLVHSLLIHVDGAIIFHPCSCPISLSSEKPSLYLSSFVFISSVVRSLVSSHPLRDPYNPYVLNSSVIHRTPVRVLKNFSDLRTLHIDLPSSELSFNDSPTTLLRWSAHFGSSLDRCLILSSASSSAKTLRARTGSESVYPKLGMAWARGSLSAAVRRHYLIEPIIAEHPSLERVVVTDADGHGVLCMGRAQLMEMRKKPILACNRRRIPATSMWEWYTPAVELSCGVVLQGVTLVAVLPTNGGEMELGWIEEGFDGDGDGMYAEAVRFLLKEMPERVR